MSLLCQEQLVGQTSGWENRFFQTTYPQQQQKPYNGQVTKVIRKKPKRNRTAFTTNQLNGLEKAFARSRYIDQQSRKELARQLNIEDKCVKIWFQNRRMKEKKDPESGCDSSSESLTSPKNNNNNDVKDEIVIKNEQTFETQPNIIQPYTLNPCATYPNYYQPDTTNHFYNANPTDYQNQALHCNNYYWQFNNDPNSMTSAFYYDYNVYPSEYNPNFQHNAYQTHKTNWVCELPELINYDI